MQKRLFLCGALMISGCLVGANEHVAVGDGWNDYPAYADATSACPSCPTEVPGCQQKVDKRAKDVSYRLTRDNFYEPLCIGIERYQNGHIEELSADSIKRLASHQYDHFGPLTRAISAFDFDHVISELHDIKTDGSRVALLPVLKHFESVLNRNLFYQSCVSTLCAVGSVATLGGIAYRLRTQNMAQMYGTTQLGYGLVATLGAGSFGLGALASATNGRRGLKCHASCMLEGILSSGALVVGGDERQVASELERITKKLS